MRSSFLLACLAIVPATTFAQNWVVGVPVNMHLTSVFNIGGCAPNVDVNWIMEQSFVTGVARCAVLTDVQPPGSTVTILPGLTNAVQGDTLWITSSVTRAVFLNAGSGFVQLDFYDIGTPTVAGETYQCAFNAIWISNLGICPEGLSYTQAATCTVLEFATAVVEADPSIGQLFLPTAANGDRLRMDHTLPGGYVIVDAIGRVVSSGNANTLLAGVDLSDQHRGTYVLELNYADGTRRTERFLLQP